MGRCSSARRGGSGADLTVGPGADVTVRSGVSGLGAGTGGTGFGSARIDGVLRPPDGQLLIPDSDSEAAEVVVGETGRILGTTLDPTTDATVSGAGQIDNHGVIALLDSLLTGVSVRDHSYRVTFDTAGADTPTPLPVRVLGPSFSTSHRTFPADPTKAGVLFAGWRTEEGGLVTSDSELPGSSLAGEVVDVDLTASWVTLALELDVTAVTLTAGETATVAPAVVTSAGDPYPSDPMTWTITGAADELARTVDTASGEITVGGTEAGTFELLLTVPSPLGDLTATLTVTVTPAAPAELALEASATEVDQGGTVTITATHVSGATAAILIEVIPPPLVPTPPDPGGPLVPGGPAPPSSPTQPGGSLGRGVGRQPTRPSAPRPRGQLPVTGAPMGLVLAVGGLLVAAGASARRAGRRLD